MKNRTYLIGLSVTFLSLIAPSAFAADAPTMNQPDNGFYEGPDPEWATLHATSVQGTETHRQYHRDAAKTHLLWHAEHPSHQASAPYLVAHRIIHQVRNLLHRQFHTSPLTP